MRPSKSACDLKHKMTRCIFWQRSY